MLSLHNIVSCSHCHKFSVKITGQSSLEKGYSCQHCHEIWGHSEALVTTLVTNTVTKWLKYVRSYRNKEWKECQYRSLMCRNRWRGHYTRWAERDGDEKLCGRGSETKDGAKLERRGMTAKLERDNGRWRRSRHMDGNETRRQWRRWDGGSGRDETEKKWKKEGDMRVGFFVFLYKR